MFKWMVSYCFIFYSSLMVCANAQTEENRHIAISISQQKLFLYQSDKLIKTYRVSSSKFGTGHQQDSFKTPLGQHQIAKKIGTDAPLNTIFIARKQTDKTAQINQEQGDVITSRILWLTGLEEGVNKGGNVDSYQRFIYIHGTADEAMIGQPASHGCVRMLNQDVIDLFEQVAVNTLVEIVL